MRPARRSPPNSAALRASRRIGGGIAVVEVDEHDLRPLRGGERGEAFEGELDERMRDLLELAPRALHGGAAAGRALT